MEVKITNEAEKTLVKLIGRVDTTNAEKFQADLSQFMIGQQNIEIDCSELDYTSSQGLRVFLILQKSIVANGGKMVLKNMKPQVKEVFDITGFSSIIKIE